MSVYMLMIEHPTSLLFVVQLDRTRDVCQNKFQYFNVEENPLLELIELKVNGQPFECLCDFYLYLSNCK